MTKRVTGDGVRPGKVNRKLSLLKSILHAAEFDNIIPSNPMRGRRVKRLQEDNNREQQILEIHITDDQLRKLIEAGGEWFGVVLRLAVELGMRQGEILKAEWRNFNLALRTLRVRKENAKSKEERTISLGPKLAAGLALIPLALGSQKPGREIEAPMAVVILFGLLSSTLLNMIVVPVVYLRFGNRRWKSRSREREPRSPLLSSD